MAENLGEEIFNNPTNTQTENLSDEVVSTDEMETVITKLETENMEVHRHPHHVMHKKKWGEYIVEFFMLFLAVFLGFVAENYREHEAEKKRAKEYVMSMVQDLKSDSAIYETTLARNELSCRMIDTLINMLAEKSSNTGHIYYLARSITVSQDNFKPTTETFEQLKSSGSLRLITNKKVIDSINAYYQALKWFELDNNLQFAKVNDVHSGNSFLFNAVTFQKMFTDKYVNNENTMVGIQEPEGNPPLLSNDTNIINTVMMRYHYLLASLKLNDGVASLAKERVKSLATLLQKEYRFE